MKFSSSKTFSLSSNCMVKSDGRESVTKCNNIEDCDLVHFLKMRSR